MVMHAKEAGSDQSIPGAFPSEVEHGAEIQKEPEDGDMDHLESKGKTAKIGSAGCSRSRGSKPADEDEDDGWLRSLDELESQLVRDLTEAGFQQTHHHEKLSLRQLKIRDDVEIMDAMERGEW